MSRGMTREVVVKSFVSGGVAGMCAKTTVAPLDRLKILLQAHNKMYDKFGPFSGLRAIVLREGVTALYRGNGAQMVRVFPYSATQFCSYEFYKKLLQGNRGTSSSVISQILPGSMAGVTAVSCTYPFDMVRARLAFQVTGEQKYKGILNTMLKIMREEGGVRGLYRGYLPTVCGMIPYGGLTFFTYENLKHFCMKYIPEYTTVPCENNTGGRALRAPVTVFCGGLAGALGQTFSYPMDVTRRRMQLSMMHPDTSQHGISMMGSLTTTYHNHGVIKGLYRGLSINYLRIAPMSAVSFTVYEAMKRLLHLDTGIKIATG